MEKIYLHCVFFETGGSQGTVGLVSRVGDEVRVWAQEIAATDPARQALPALDGLLKQQHLARSDLAAVAFAQGPGGFTGLRVGCGLAQGVAFALDLPVLPLPSLLAVAEHDRANRAPTPSCARVVLQDARMEELYLAVYTPDAAAWRTLQAPSLIGVESLPAWLATARTQWVDAQGQPLALRAVGDALRAYPTLATLATLPLFESCGDAARPDAHAWARLALDAWDRGAHLPPERAAPLYVRDKIAYTTHERSQGLGGNPRAAGIVRTPAPPTMVPMTAQHLAQVLDIERSVQSHPWTCGNFRDALQSGYVAWVVLHDGRVQGFYVLMLAPDVGHLLVLAVARDAQRRGLGRWLMQHAGDQVLRAGLDAVLLEVRPSNLAARAFYQQLGFEPHSVRKDYYPAARGAREDALVLRKSLTARPEGAPA